VPKVQIYNVLKSTSWSKIHERGDDYFELTYESAPGMPERLVTAGVELPQTIDAEVISFFESHIDKIKKIPPKVPGDPYTYELEILGKLLILKSTEIGSSRKFETRWFEEFSTLPPVNLKGERWRSFVNLWQHKEVVVEDKEVSDETYAMDELISHLTKCVITEDRELATRNPNYLLYVDGVLLYPGRFVKQRLEHTGVKIDLGRLAKLLKSVGYLAGDSKLVWVGTSPVRFWQFDPVALEIDPQKVLEEVDSDDL